jgi:hypothetical protein
MKRVFEQKSKIDEIEVRFLFCISNQIRDLCFMSAWLCFLVSFSLNLRLLQKLRNSVFIFILAFTWQKTDKIK